MSETLKLASLIPPSVNHYLAYRVVYRGGRAIPVSYETKEAKDFKSTFKDYVAREVARQGFARSDRHIYCDCRFYFDRVDRDPNNYYKLLWDAISETGLVWEDDNVVCERCLSINYDTQNPRIEIEIYPVEYVGIFPTDHHRQRFESKCQRCTRSTRNCSIFTKALKGFIQPDITNLECKRYKERKE
jgi:Holliday junction resolvase RusA-like endonuclease